MEDKRKLKKQNNKGITLIALVITIIVMLILAGVSISLVLDENNGIIKRTQVAVNAYDDGRIREEGMLQTISNTFDEYLAKIGQSEQTGGGNSQEESGTPITSVITPTNVASHIGEYINLGTNLTTTGQQADWRIFDADETGVYAILSDYLVGEYVSTTMKVSNEIDAEMATMEVRGGRYVLFPADGGDYYALKAVGILKTASNWDSLVSNSSPLRGKITGAPTYEQFAKSWNKVNSSVQQMNEATPTEYFDLTDNTGIYLKSDDYYFYWLATPCSGNLDKVVVADQMNICFGADYYDPMDDPSNRSWEGRYLRPLVHLTSDIKVSGQDANGVWQMVE